VLNITRTCWFWPAVIAALAWGAILAALDPCGDHPGLFDGPGLTVDESFNVAQGVALVNKLFEGDLAGFRQVDAQLPDHPPLGRLWIGLCHELAYLASPPVDPTVPYSITCARTAPATAFAALVFLVGFCAGRWYGQFSGASAAIVVVLMPRVFGHAHLAALETMVNLSCTAVVLYVAAKWGPAESGHVSVRPGKTSWQLLTTWRALGIAAIGGVVLGLALLTKVQAILLPIPVAVWALAQMRLRAVPLLLVWGLTGLIVLFACWPYLWSAPFDHMLRYLGRTTNRSELYVWYFGRVIADRDVPWHYPWVMFLMTVPVGLLGLGVCGLFGPIRRAWKSPRELLILACLLFPLVVFSVPRVPVYDGERLFSFVFPLWAVLIGRGAENVRQWAHSRLSPRMASAGLSLFLAAQSYGLWSMAPCWLSYYNLLVGGLPGAAKLGLEVSYWGDGVTRTLLADAARQLPDGARMAAIPSLHEAQWPELRMQSPILKRRNLRFVPWLKDQPHPAHVLLFARQEYLPEEYRPKNFRGSADDRRIVAAVYRQGILLAGLIEDPRGTRAP
jgi:hypothetical protein